MPIHKNSDISFYIFLALFLNLLAPTAHSQPEKPGNRYLNAYTQYLGATCPIEQDSIKHFVYFARDREAIHEHPFLKIPRLEGAQIMYPWRQLEPEKGEYDFSMILEDYAYLRAHGKQLFIQLQDATFNPAYPGVPDYLRTEAYDGGAVYQYNDAGKPEGWVAKRWNPQVQARFALLLEALGNALDGKIEGINLQETAIGVNHSADSTFSPEIYTNAVRVNMLALKKAFPLSTTMQYANFMPGEWLPRDDKGFLRGVYRYGDSIGVSLGAPDLLVQRKGQLNHPIAMMHEGKYRVPLGIAVQDGNYIGQTGASTPLRERNNLVPLLHAFAKDFLRVKYMFWTYEEPYFSEDMIPCFSAGYKNLPKTSNHWCLKSGQTRLNVNFISPVTKLFHPFFSKSNTMEIRLPHTIETITGEKLTFLSITKKDGKEYLEGENEARPNAGPPMHVHYKQDEYFTVVSGTMGYQILGAEKKYAGPGESILFKAGVPHKFWNAGTENLHCTGYISPPDNIVYFLSHIFQSTNENGGRPGLYDAAFLLNRYKDEFGMLEIPKFVQRFIFPIVLFIGNLFGRQKKFIDAPPPV